MNTEVENKSGKIRNSLRNKKLSYKIKSKFSNKKKGKRRIWEKKKG